MSLDHRDESAMRASGAQTAREPSDVQAPINAVDAARQAARSDADHSERFRRVAIIVSMLVGCGLALLVIVVAWRGVVGALLSDGSDEEQAMQAADASNPETGVVRYADGGSLFYSGYSYSITKTDGDYAFTVQSEPGEGEPAVVFTLSGKPLGFVLCDGIFYVVSNRDGRFFVQSLMPGDGSLPSDYYEGEGTMVDIGLEGTELQLTEENGRAYTLELAPASL